ncbi:hypothetical protein L7F22_065356 [Adiantum nelumboides]|nr:hypothetical protein [Adiantum nelumboides]
MESVKQEIHGSQKTRQQVNQENIDSPCMSLRSDPSKRRHRIDQEASSHAIATRSPCFKRGGKRRRKCIFVDDEATLEEGSNHLQCEDDVKGDESQELPVEVEIGEDVEDEDLTKSDGIDEENVAQHSRHLGKKIPLGIMKDVLSQFYLKQRSNPPLIPICCLVAHEAVRVATNAASWLIPNFDNAAYLETMGSFLVSMKDSFGSYMPVTSLVKDSWDPIWQVKSVAFDNQLNKEWQEL